MLKSAKIIIVLLLVSLLSACSIISDLIPEQEVELFPTDNGSNVIESSSPVSDAPPPSMEDFFSGTEANDLVGQAAAAKYIAINLYREFKDGDAPERADITSQIEQGFSVRTITLESQTAVQFPDKLVANLYSPNFWVWDGFVGPEENTYFWWLPQDRRNEITASYLEANKQNLAMFLPKEQFNLSTGMIEAMRGIFFYEVIKVEDLGVVYIKDSANCSETKCMYTLIPSELAYCTADFCRAPDEHDDGSIVSQQQGARDYYSVKDALYNFVMPSQLLTKLAEVATEGKTENSISLSVWLKLRSFGGPEIPSDITATASLFLPNATAKVDFTN